MSIEKDMIPIDEELNEFKVYLKTSKRCILSAKFGDGKSFFLTKFMEKYSDEYIFIPIYPINYQVAENKDVFEYIKRDILVRLLATQKVYIDKIGERTLNALFGFLRQRNSDVFEFVADILPSINIPLPGGIASADFDLKQIVESCKLLNAKYKEYKAPEHEVAENFINSFADAKGSLYEFDPISQLITTILKNSQHDALTKKKREIVLIVEDLDRMDPAHIFRILNILSAHFEWSGNSESCELGNKFGFDKILLVADYNNVKKIYHHMYGSKTDFEGYIHKFSPISAYHFSLRKSKLKFITDHLHPRMNGYPKIKELMAIQIAGKSGLTIRKLKSLLEKEPAIREWKEELKDGRYVKHHENDYAYFLRICTIFKINIDWKEFAEEYMGVTEEYMSLIGRGWVAVAESVDAYTIMLNVRNHKNRDVEITIGEFLFGEDKKEFIDVNIHSGIYSAMLSGEPLTIRGQTILSNEFTEKIPAIAALYIQYTQIRSLGS